MNYPPTGYHHITACAGDAQEDVDFEGLLPRAYPAARRWESSSLERGGGCVKRARSTKPAYC